MNKALGRLPTGIAQVPPPPGCVQELQTFKQNLPIWPHRDEITRTIAGSQVCIIEGQTGSGKTTQVQQRTCHWICVLIKFFTAWNIVIWNIVTFSGTSIHTRALPLIKQTLPYDCHRTTTNCSSQCLRESLFGKGWESGAKHWLPDQTGKQVC